MAGVEGSSGFAAGDGSCSHSGHPGWQRSGLAYSTYARRHVMARGGSRWGEGMARTLTPEEEAMAARLLGWLEAEG